MMEKKRFPFLALQEKLLFMEGEITFVKNSSVQARYITTVIGFTFKYCIKA